MFGNKHKQSKDCSSDWEFFTFMDWSTLNKQQIGKYGEYLTKMEFTKYGFDVYTAEVDDKGIDFVIRNSGDKYFDIQVKSIRRYVKPSFTWLYHMEYNTRKTNILQKQAQTLLEQKTFNYE